MKQKNTHFRNKNNLECDIEKFSLSDFFLPDYNLIVEIKSTYWYNKKLENNIKKHTECIKQGYNHIFIIDKEYDNFQKIINNYENYKKF